MSLHYISYVPRQLTYQGDRFAKAEEIFQWLLAENVIKPEKNEEGLSGNVYYFSDGIQKFLDVPVKSMFDTPAYCAGFTCTTKRDVYCPVENWDKGPICPCCESDLNPNTNDDEGWNRCLGEGMWKWRETGETPSIVCPTCHNSASLADYRFVPDWGFSDLGFTFYECPKLNRSFVDELERRLACRVWIVPTWS